MKSVKWMGDLFSLSDHSASQAPPKQPVQAHRKTQQIGGKEVQKAPQYWRPTTINKCEVPLTGGGCFHFGFLLPFPRLILLPRQSPTLIYSSSLRFIPFPSLLRFLPTSSSQRLFPVSLNDGFLKAFISYLISFLLMLFSFLFFFTLFLSLSR